MNGREGSGFVRLANKEYKKIDVNKLYFLL